MISKIFATMKGTGGDIGTVCALTLNLMQTDLINQVLTVVLSGLSIAYMVIKIVKELKK